ncbi:hypothetical protein RchiOBHm_Chr4g0420101 [Rosa chinensis]|uniref:Cysteine alpha-hairpin motif superfamily n=1 Tax=Rosa chinensis TaxID=74649 RepID=A0A2P6QXR7_ROSCH|nr:cytochrome c oxidase assembly factor 4 homolog, mitochondrial [Rosa chinensis]PRQ38987.1 hypothetical protein RchiOBHm_Chr4g0420101 [Rosa chinensis]
MGEKLSKMTRPETKAEPKPKPSDQSQPPPPPLHSEVEDDDENVKQLKECSALYLSLQDCLIKNDRNWKSCQLEVQALKQCNERKQKKNDKEK